MANDALRRIMAEVKEFAALNSSPTAFFHALPLETDLFEWHFTVRGPPDTAFEHGVYHGRILLPAEYPLKAPEIILLTPNGRFEVGRRICLSVTSHHQETWQPSWGIRTILTALVGFMPSKAEGLGALDYPDKDRRGLARKSHLFRCARCGACPAEQVPPREPIAGSASTAFEAGPSSASTEASAGPGTGEAKEERRSVDVAQRASEEPDMELQQDKELDPGESAQTMQSGNISVDDIGGESMSAGSLRRSGGEDDGSVDATGADSTGETGSSGVAAQVAAVEEDEVSAGHAADRRSSSRLPGGPSTESQVSEAMGMQTRRSSNSTGRVQEKELLYVAYAVVALMVAVVARRVLKMVTE